MPKPAIALYLGETYASLGIFNRASGAIQFEKSVFLPQVSLKNLLSQAKNKLQELQLDSEGVSVFVVTNYFDRLKQFRLGGSISQVIAKGFENSYSLKDSKLLSLAASQLIITIENENVDTSFLQSELDRVKKVNPDLNKVVIALPESKFTSAQVDQIVNFFTAAGLKIFLCAQPHNQSELRKTLLNAGSEGTREEVSKDLSEAFGAKTEIFYFCHNGFKSKFENAELFNSSNNFFAHWLKKNNLNHGAYFDVETFKFLKNQPAANWESPWGTIPIDHFDQTEFEVHPFAELKLDQLSMLSFDKSSIQLEPGPVVAGRAIKPLVLDLFWQELKDNGFCAGLFSALAQDNLKSKIQNIFSVLEKGQKSSSLFVSGDELKNQIRSAIHAQVDLLASGEAVRFYGPLADVFKSPRHKPKEKSFSWPQEIIAMAEANGGLPS
jgi:hypothetical protein